MVSTRENTGPTVVTVSFWVIGQCLRWARGSQLTRWTTNAKRTKIAKSAFEPLTAKTVSEKTENIPGAGFRKKTN